jgi:hypothetical protein
MGSSQFLREAGARVPLRLVGHCLMPNLTPD